MSTSNSAIVTTRAGKIEGYFRDGLYVFKGVPYAAPPVGEKRWLPPQPLEPWKGTRDAKNCGPISPQDAEAHPVFKEQGITVIHPPVPEPQSEDCLFLNIWTPGLDDAKRPVMLWIHGGGFRTGSGSLPDYSGRKLAARGNTVIVTINYRLGVLGFMNLNEITGGKIPATGNEALLDKIAALEWVRDNIAAFGGDPGNVTIFGESAGAVSCGCLLAMPRARGLFHRAILQSGTTSTSLKLDQAVELSRLFLQVLKISPDDTEAIRAVTVPELLKAQDEFQTTAFSNTSKVSAGFFRPVVDGKVLPLQPLEAVRKGDSSNIPVLVGTTLDEMGLALRDRGFAIPSELQLVERLRSFIPVDYIPGLIEAYRKAKTKRGEPVTPVDLFVAIQTDRLFRAPGIRLAEVKQNKEKPAWYYILTWRSPALGGKMGSCHMIDLGLVFGTYEKKFTGEGPVLEALSAKMQDAWLAFAKNGDPTCESLDKWPSYGSKREIMMFGEKCYLENDPLSEERRAWDNIPLDVLG